MLVVECRPLLWSDLHVYVWTSSSFFPSRVTGFGPGWRWAPVSQHFLCRQSRSPSLPWASWAHFLLGSPQQGCSALGSVGNVKAVGEGFSACSPSLGVCLTLFTLPSFFCSSFFSLINLLCLISSSKEVTWQLLSVYLSVCVSKITFFFYFFTSSHLFIDV